MAHDRCVPGAESAVIEDAKLLEYALSPESEQGRHKAGFFEAIGYTRADYEELRGAVLDELPNVEGIHKRTREDGTEHFEARITIRRRDKDGTADIRTI